MIALPFHIGIRSYSPDVGGSGRNDVSRSILRSYCKTSVGANGVCDVSNHRRWVDGDRNGEWASNAVTGIP